MNWQKRMLTGLGLAVVALTLLSVPHETMVPRAGPKPAYADQYQLAVSSFTVFWVQVSTFQLTQVDSPQLSGRKNITIYNLDTSSPVYCRQDNLVSLIGVRNDTTQPSNTFTLAPAGASSPNPPSSVSLSLSNYASIIGAYPTSTTMPVYCVSAHPGSGGTAPTVLLSTVAVVQSY